MSEPVRRPPSGPYEWGGDQHGISLFTQHSGRIPIMSFARFGLQGAQPVFPVRSTMVKADQLVEFDVGDGTARGFAQGRDNPSVYRYQISAIDHPVARLLAASGSLLDLVEGAVGIMQQCEVTSGVCGCGADISLDGPGECSGGGHAPVDVGSKFASEWLKQAKKTLDEIMPPEEFEG